jgi:5-methylcytosine-specific restriction endonuclease McrA
MPSKDPAKRLAASRARYATKKAEVRAYINAWRKDNPERRREEYARQKARPDFKAKQQAYVQANSDKITAYQAQYREEHREELRQQGRVYRAANRETIKARRQQRYAVTLGRDPLARQQKYRRYRETSLAARKLYYAKNREAILEDGKARQKLYYRANREKILAKNALWEKNHPEVKALKNALRKARKRNAPVNDLSRTQWQEIKAHYGQRCFYCGRKMQRLTMDHIIPLSKGGSHTASNIVPACLSCNSRKLTGPPPVPVQPLLLTVAPARKKRRKPD